MKNRGNADYHRYLANNAQTLELLVHSYSDALVRFAYSLVHNSHAAEDIAAESIAILLMKNKKFRDDGHMRAYLYKIARYKAMDYLRLHRHFVALEDVEKVLGSGDPESDMVLRQRDEIIYRCMQALPEHYRQVLQLSFFDGFAIGEICGIMKKSTKQVYNLLARAKIALKDLLEKEGITHEDI
jgi:RNA polymerase sigma-70 factor (ECF subfamily)